MGCASSCFGAPDDEFSGSNNGCWAQFHLLYEALSIRARHSTDHDQVTSQPTSALNNFVASTTPHSHRVPSTTTSSRLRYSQLQPDIDTRDETQSNHSQVDPELQSERNILITYKMLIEARSNKCNSELHLDSAVRYLYHSSEDSEDECPICLEGYTPDNPMIITKCSHNYHLGCLYEWEKRSESCPICGRIMLFEEMI